MRVDFDILLPLIKGTEMYKCFRKISELEKFTLLTPPYEPEDVKELVLRAQHELKIKVHRDYYWFLKCCDGGLLFTNFIYSILCPDDEESDFVSVNTYLREEERIPVGTAAIGTTNYGAYILIDAAGNSEMSLWDAEEEEYLAKYANLYEWLDDAVQEALFLLETDDLPEIYDDDEEEEEDEGAVDDE